MDASAVFKAVGDPTRQRILQVLLQHELSVTEITDVVGKPQSTVSRHLKALRESGLTLDRRDGVTVYYRPNRSDLDGNPDAVRALIVRWLWREPIPTSLRGRIDRVLERRHAETVGVFESVGRRWDQLRTDCFGGRFHLEALTALLPKSWVVADIGAGTGYLLGPLAAAFARVIAVEPVDSLLQAARHRPDLCGVTNVEFRAGDLRNLPVESGSVDLALAVLVLHHVADPGGALAEMRRVTRPGGRMLIVEEKTHRCEAFRERMPGRWWGFDPEVLAEHSEAAGFEEVRHRALTTAAPASASVPETPELFVLTAVRRADPMMENQS